MMQKLKKKMITRTNQYYFRTIYFAKKMNLQKIKKLFIKIYVLYFLIACIVWIIVIGQDSNYLFYNILVQLTEYPSKLIFGYTNIFLMFSINAVFWGAFIFIIKYIKMLYCRKYSNTIL